MPTHCADFNIQTRSFRHNPSSLFVLKMENKKSFQKREATRSMLSQSGYLVFQTKQETAIYSFEGS